MPDRFTITTHKSWFSRIGQAIVGIGVGLLLFAAAFPLLWWNEGRAVHRLRSLEEGARLVIDVPSDTISPANDGKLVHVVGLATSEQTLTDPDFGISAAAITLQRIAETYQWREESSSKKRKKLGGGEETTTTYRYEKTWSRGHIDSSSFKSPDGHENPSSLQWESRTVMAGRVTCGAFTLPQELVGKIGGAAARPAEPDDEDKMRARGFALADGDVFYKGASASSPQIGDVRVRFEVILPQTVSLVATQRGATFEAYHARAGSDILMLEAGGVPADRMFQAAQTTNRITTWALRGAGFLAMFVGLALVLRPLSVLGSLIPLVGSLLGAGTGLVAFLAALAFSFTTMAVAWLAYRPLLGILLLGAAIGSLVLLRRARRPRTVVPPPIPTGA